MVVSSQEAYFKLARSALTSRQEAVNSCILFDRIHVVDDQPVANIVCMYRLLSVRSLHHTTIKKLYYLICYGARRGTMKHLIAVTAVRVSLLSSIRRRQTSCCSLSHRAGVSFEPHDFPNRHHRGVGTPHKQ